MATTAAITFGSLPLLTPTPPATAYEIDACADGTDYGNPEATVAAVASMLMDGDQAQITRYGNRTATVKLRVKGATLDIVAAGTAAIEAEVNRGRNALTWLPPGTATASVFDVVYSTLDFQYDDLVEVMQVTRYFTLTLTCAPFARRATPNTVTATAVAVGAPTVTSIDACTATTGWASSTGTIALADAGTSVRQTTTAPDTVLAQMAKTGLSAAIAVGEYVTVEISTANSNSPSWIYDDIRVYLNGSSTPAVLQAAVPSVSGVSTTYYFPRPAATLTSVKVAETTLPSPAWITVHDISKVNKLPFTGTTAQRLMSLTVGGSARTTADLQIDATSSKIGEEGIVYTYRAGAVLYPPLRNSYLTSAGASTTAGISGAANTFSAPAVLTIPASAIPPGSYLLVARVARVSATGNLSFNWTATTTGALTDTTLDQTGSVVASAMTTAYRHVDLGVLSLPTVAVGSGSAANVVLTVSSPDTTNAKWDEFWLFGLDSGQLTRMKVPISGTTGSKMVIKSATVTGNLRPQWLMGTYNTTANDIDAGGALVAGGVHVFDPGIMSVFVVTPGDTSQVVTATLYERFRHHVTAP